MNKSKVKRGTSLILSVIMALTLLAGCGSNDGESESSSSYYQPTYDYSAPLDDNGSFKGVTAGDYITLPEYMGIEIPADTQEVSEDDIQAEIDSVIESYTYPEQITDRAVEDGDTVNIDYTGSIDGVEFDGGSTGGAGTSVTIGETEYIDDFLEQLIGHKPGETFDVEVTFPDEYSANPDLEGKDAVFETTINYIEGETITPEFNDEFVAEYLQPTYGWTTTAEVTAQIEENISETQISNYIWEYLRDNSEVSEIPDVMFENEANTMLYQCESYAGMYGMTVEEYLESAFELSSTDELIEEYRDQLETSCKDYLIVLAIAEEQNVEVNDEDIAAYFEDGGVTDYSQYEETYGVPFLKFQVKIQTVNDFLRDNAVLL